MTATTSRLSGLRRLLGEADMAVFLVTLASYVLRLVSNVALSYVLYPEAFGLVAITTTVMVGLQNLFDTAMYVGMVGRKGDIPRAELDSFWTLQFGRGVVITALSFALGPLIAWIYGEPELTFLLGAGSLSLLLNGLASLRPILEVRKGRPQLLMNLEVARQVLSAIGIIAVGLYYPSPWAIVWGGLIGGIAYVILSYWGDSYRPRLFMQRGFMSEQLRFMRWFQVASMFSFMGAQVDKIVFPLFFGASLFGVYTIAQTLAMIPLALGQRWAFQVFMPAIQRILHDGDRLDHVDALRPRMIAMTYAAILCAGVVAASGPFFSWVYPADFALAATFSPLMAVAIFFNLSEAALRQPFIVSRRQMFDALGEVSRLAIFLSLIGILIYGREADAMRYIQIYVVTQIIVYFAYVVLARGFHFTRLRGEAIPLLAFIVLSAVFYGLAQVSWAALGPVAALLILGIVGGAALLLMFRRYGLPRAHRGDETVAGDAGADPQPAEAAAVV